MPPDLETALSFGLTAAACLAGAVVDVCRRRIPNRITFPAMVLLLVMHGIFSGLPGLKESALGLVGGFLIMLIPHAFGVLGAGDVKLMAVVGAGLGSGGVVTAVLFTSLAGGLQIVLWLAWMRLRGLAGGQGFRICYGPAIAAGAIGAMILVLSGMPYITLTWPGAF